MPLFFQRQRIAVVELYGTIGGSIKSSSYERIFSAIEKARRLRALVLDVDCPGGSATASDYLYRSVLKVARQKPVVACIRGVGASGGYMVSCAAQRIVAAPGALVGSIGVISIRPVLQALMDRLGVAISVKKSGQFKDLGAFWRKATAEEERKLQELVDESYKNFISAVAQARHMDEDRVRSLATGEVFWAPRALELGLVDELGDVDRAIDIAAELSGAPRRPMAVRRPRRGLRELLFGAAAESLVDSLATELERRIWSSFLRY